MRIAYISLHWPRSIASGVGKKIGQQIALWKENGHEVCFFMHSHPYPDTDKMVDGNYFIYPMQKGPIGFVLTEFNRIAAFLRMTQSVKAYQPDIIFLRWGMYVFPMHRLAKIAPVAIEINTNDVQQHQMLGKIYSRYNILTRSVMFRHSAGLVCASVELANDPEFARYHKPTCVVSNGFILEDTKPFPAPQNALPHLVFSGTPGYPWHGVDKLVDFARIYPDLIIDIIGYDSLAEPGPLTSGSLPANLYLHGYLKGTAYTNVLAQADAAFGTLALHRKGMEEASPLKTRECLARGIPLILPYKDTDLDDLECDYLLKIPNREDNLKTHGQLVHDFAYAVRGKRGDFNQFAPRIDSRIKETKRLSFFKELATQ